MGVNKIPKSLQPILWSQDIKTLDLKKNKVYIINQILRFGSINDLRWLYKTYPEKTIKDVFTKNPQPIYTPSSYYFVKNLLLKINKSFDETRYLKSLT